MDAITLHISGNNRYISAEVFLKHVAAALRDTTLKAGEHRIEIDSEGGIWLNGMKVYTPSRPQIAKKGA